MDNNWDKKKGTTKSGGRKHDLDKFYTKPEIAVQCILKIKNLGSFNTIIEPSAGNGSFSKQLINLDINKNSNIIAYDIIQKNIQ